MCQSIFTWYCNSCNIKFIVLFYFIWFFWYVFNMVFFLFYCCIFSIENKIKNEEAFVCSFGWKLKENLKQSIWPFRFPFKFNFSFVIMVYFVCKKSIVFVYGFVISVCSKFYQSVKKYIVKNSLQYYFVVL